MTRNPPPSSEAPSMTTETFQKHYGRGSGYPVDPSHHAHPPPPPPPPHNYPPSQYSSGQHAPPPYPPPAHRGSGGPPPPSHGHGHGYHHQSWYYPPHAPAAPAPMAGVHPSEMVGSSSSRRNASRPVKKSINVPPSLVTPKSYDSETPPTVAADTNKADSKKPAKSSTKKATNAKSRGKKEKNNKLPSANNDKDLEMEEEPKVEPMKQDFHFYAMDHFEDAKKASQQQLERSIEDGSIPQKGKESELYLLTTLLNARLIRNWEGAPKSTHAEYLKKEEADRKRFMSEEEVASRHCATLTARRRSPKQSGCLGRMGSFGLTSTVEANSLGVVKVEGSMNRTIGEADVEVLQSAAKRVKMV
mmetsp:Transcript_3005/g.6706  ORF Transcript_3005/g.6706 Transcript_3005/m.6706 type:complete len:359 (-) Transcript_3005:250-1326(-)